MEPPGFPAFCLKYVTRARPTRGTRIVSMRGHRVHPRGEKSSNSAVFLAGARVVYTQAIRRSISPVRGMADGSRSIGTGPRRSGRVTRAWNQTVKRELPCAGLDSHLLRC